MSRRSVAQKRRHERDRDPLAFCYRCTKRACMTALNPTYHALGLVGICFQHSPEGKGAAAKRAAMAKAAPDLVDMVAAFVAAYPEGPLTKPATELLARARGKS